MQLIPQAKLVLTLLEKKKAREKEGLFVIEGEKLVAEGLDKAKFLLYSENLPVVKKASAHGIPAYKISKQAMERITSVETPPGVVAVVETQRWELSKILAKKNPLLLFAAEIQDPGNFGTMIRVIDAVSGTGVIASKGTVDPYNPKVVRSTMGSIFRVPVIHSNDIIATIELLKKNKIKVVGADSASGNDYWGSDLKGPTAVLIGNESAGLKDEVLKNCSETVKIPMPGRAESLNAAMAATLILYEALRQRTVG